MINNFQKKVLSEEEKENIIVTYISNDRDYKGVLFLNFNLKRLNSKYRLGCIVLDDGVTQQTKLSLSKEGIKLFEFNLKKVLTERYGFARMDVVDYIVSKNYYGKFLIHLLDASAYKKILYLDTDLLLLKNIDHLFERIDVLKKDEIHMTFDLSKRVGGIVVFKANQFNSGVILCVPNEKISDACFCLLRDHYCRINLNINEIEKILGTDQTIYDHLALNNEFLKVKHLEYRYNCVSGISKHLSEIKLLRKKDIAIVHFILNPKPWNFVDMESSVLEGNFFYSDSEIFFEEWIELYTLMVKNNLKKAFSKKTFCILNGGEFILTQKKDAKDNLEKILVEEKAIFF